MISRIIIINVNKKFNLNCFIMNSQVLPLPARKVFEHFPYGFRLEFKSYIIQVGKSYAIYLFWYFSCYLIFLGKPKVRS